MAAIQDAQSNLARVQEQLSSGERIRRSGEDPSAFTTATRLDARQELLTGFERASDRAFARLSLTESRIGEAVDQTNRVRELVEGLPFAALGQNIFDAEWDEPSEEFAPYEFFERGGTKIAVIGQAFPYTPIANPSWLFPDYSFGIRDERMQEMVNEVRGQGAELVVVLSHNGFDVDKQMATVVEGIDVILSGHTHDAVPEPVLVGETMIVASGSNGKFVSRVDLDVRDGRMMGFRHKLIPIFSDVIEPEAEMTALIDEQRAPYEAEMGEVIGQTDSLLYRRDLKAYSLFIMNIARELSRRLRVADGILAKFVTDVQDEYVQRKH